MNHSPYFGQAALSKALQAAPDELWLVTGAAGFIGSHLVEALLVNGVRVRGMDSFVTGFESNLNAVRRNVGEEAWSRFEFLQADICDSDSCKSACEGVSRVLHQAALGSVPRSIDAPEVTDAANVGGFVKMMAAAREAGVRRFVYASSSAVYGDDPSVAKSEDRLGAVLSPYALSKLVNEQYAAVFARCYGLESVGLRYFNVFGPRQDPQGAYAAVVPSWYAAILRGEPIYINGDGETSRDFCHVANVVQANVLAALTTNPEAVNRSYNVACGEKTTLNELARLISESVSASSPGGKRVPQIVYREFREGDIRHSLADISRATRLLGYTPSTLIGEGLQESASYYASVLPQ
jgi:UDP-N-acetylglucosamine/UDP-N-acetylgalactosamine 4-epimerase